MDKYFFSKHGPEEGEIPHLNGFHLYCQAGDEMFRLGALQAAGAAKGWAR